MMELILFFTSNNNLRGFFKDKSEKKVFCKKLKEKTKTRADKYVCFICGEIRMETIVIDEKFFI